MRASAVVVALMLAACGPPTPSQYCKNVWAASEPLKLSAPIRVTMLLNGYRLQEAY